MLAARSPPLPVSPCNKHSWPPRCFGHLPDLTETSVSELGGLLRILRPVVCGRYAHNKTHACYHAVLWFGRNLAYEWAPAANWEKARWRKREKWYPITLVNSRKRAFFWAINIIRRFDKRISEQCTMTLSGLILPTETSADRSGLYAYHPERTNRWSKSFLSNISGWITRAMIYFIITRSICYWFAVFETSITDFIHLSHELISDQYSPKILLDQRSNVLFVHVLWIQEL